MRRLEHCNIVQLKYFFYSSGDKVIYPLLMLPNNTKWKIYYRDLMMKT